MRDDAGGVLRPVARSGRASGSASTGVPADPLITLLEPPDGRLGPGREVTVVLWGPKPGSSARLEGSFGSLALRAQEIDADALARSLARLNRPFIPAGERR